MATPGEWHRGPYYPPPPYDGRSGGAGRGGDRGSHHYGPPPSYPHQGPHSYGPPPPPHPSHLRGPPYPEYPPQGYWGPEEEGRGWFPPPRPSARLLEAQKLQYRKKPPASWPEPPRASGSDIPESRSKDEADGQERPQGEEDDRVSQGSGKGEGGKQKGDPLSLLAKVSSATLDEKKDGKGQKEHSEKAEGKTKGKSPVSRGNGPRTSPILSPRSRRRQEEEQGEDKESGDDKREKRHPAPKLITPTTSYQEQGSAPPSFEQAARHGRGQPRYHSRGPPLPYPPQYRGQGAGPYPSYSPPQRPSSAPRQRPPPPYYREWGGDPALVERPSFDSADSGSPYEGRGRYHGPGPYYPPSPEEAGPYHPSYHEYWHHEGGMPPSQYPPPPYHHPGRWARPSGPPGAMGPYGSAASPPGYPTPYRASGGRPDRASGEGGPPPSYSYDEYNPPPAYAPYTHVQQPRLEEKTVLKKKFSWKHYPEVCSS